MSKSIYIDFVSMKSNISCTDFKYVINGNMVYCMVRCPSLLLFKSVVKDTRLFECESIKLADSEILWHAKGKLYRRGS